MGYGANAANVIGDGMGDGYGHGRGFAADDGANLEVDLVDRDAEFEIEANMNDKDIENDLEIKMADRDIENELEDRRDHTIQDGALYRGYGFGYGGFGYGGYGGYGYGDRGHGSVRQVGLIRNLGEAEKRRDQSYNLNEHRASVDYDDSGLLNRGKGYYGYGSGLGYAYGKDGNRQKGYQDMRSNIGRSQSDRLYDDDVGRGVGIGATYGYGSTYGYGNNYGRGYGLGSTVRIGQTSHKPNKAW